MNQRWSPGPESRRTYRVGIAIVGGMAMLGLTACSFGAPPPKGDRPPTLVEVSTAQSGTLNDRWSVPGDVRALERAELAAGASGPLIDVFVREGDVVEQGATLLQVDPAPSAARAASATASADETEAQLGQARRNLTRLDNVADDVLSDTEIDAARTQVAVLEARLRSQRATAKEASVALRRHSLRAPFAGVVTARRVDRGDWVTEGQPVLDLVSVGQIDVRVDAARELADHLAANDPVLLDDVPGHIAAVVPALDPSTRTAVIRLVPDTPNSALMPGSTVTVGFQVERSTEDGALVHRDALVLGPVDTKVVRVAEGHADIVAVKVLATSTELALVTGISPGDTVVVRGSERLRPGQALRWSGDE